MSNNELEKVGSNFQLKNEQSSNGTDQNYVDPRFAAGSNSPTNSSYGKYFENIEVTSHAVAIKNQSSPETPEPEEYNPFENRNVKYPTTDIETIIHLLKGSLGSGVLAIPLAFTCAGLWFGLVATIIVGIICTYCVHILVSCAHILCKRRKIASLSFADVAEQAFLDGPPSFRKWGRILRYTVNIFLSIDLLGCCCIYLIFVADNLQQIILYYCGKELNDRLLIALVGLPLVFMSLIRNLKFLIPFSLIANTLLLLSIVIIVCFVFIDLPAISSRPAIVEITKWPMFFGIVIFALEGIGIVMSLENEMKNPTHFIGCTGVLNIGMSIVVGLYTFVGFIGYLKYGDETRASISLNLPVENIFAQFVKLIIAIAIFLTYTLQFYVPINIIWTGLKERYPEEKHVRNELILRALTSVITILVAVAIPNLGPFISLIGAVCLSILGLIIPAIIETVVYRVDPGLGKFYWRLYKNAFLMMFGIVGLLTGTYVSIVDIIIEYKL